jgi:pimeloyl-ACP methyl ester carboxylesterase
LFAVDGAGGFHATSTSLGRAIQEQGLPLAVEVLEWSHGRGRVLADQMDCEHSVAEGRHLAMTIAEYRRTFPGREVYLVGHSAGCEVVLAAAEALPPETVNRIILLAPSVSADHDLRPALRTSRTGIDVFYSERDVGYLGLGVALVGTADRQPGPAAGRVGFLPHAANAQDLTLFAKLRQHPWHACVAWSGNRGGHYGTYEREFLKAYVLPLLAVPNT